ncbi:MAG: extracellular solute-binding protein [Oscillospiraceae bacterium]
MKKLLAFGLSTLLAVGLLAGCGGSASSASTPASTPAASVNEDGWVSIGSANAPVPVTIVVKDVLPDEADVLLLEAAVEEKMAAHGQYIDLQFLEPPAGSYGTALPLAVRSGEIDADLIYFQGGDQPLAQEGLLEDLTSYIENSTYVKNIMEPASEERMKNYPYLLWLAPARTAVPVMRKDWADQLDTYDALVADPTIDNYIAMFKELKEKGLAKYALTADGSTTRWDSVFNQAFGVTATVVQEDGTYVFSKATSAEKDKLAFYAELYAEGLIDPDYLTNSWDVAEQKFYEGEVGLYVGNIGATVKIYNDKMVSTNGEEAELVVLPPAKGVAQGYAAVDVTKEGRGFAMNADSENKDAAWAFLEFMASPEGRMLDKLGIEGVHYNVENGEIVFTDSFPNWWSRIWETTYNFEPEYPLAQPIYPQAAQDSLEMAAKYYVEDVNILVPEELVAINDGLSSLYLEYSTDVIRGNDSVDNFDSFVKKWNDAGAGDFTSYFDSELG